MARTRIWEFNESVDSRFDESRLHSMSEEEQYALLMKTLESLA